MYDLLKARNEGMREEVVSLAQKLVRTPSVSLKEKDAAAVVERAMRDAEFDTVYRDEAGNVVGCIRGREAEPTVLLLTHMDTASVGSPEQWEKPPFDGRLDGGRLHGRGAADCKGGLAAQIYAGALLKRSLLPLRGNLVVAATVAEENGGSPGVRMLMERTLPEMEMKPTFAILGEPTDLGLYYGHDGWMEIEIRVEGANRMHVSDTAHAVHADLRLLQENRAASGGPMLAVEALCFDEADGGRRATMRLHRKTQAADDAGQIVARVQREAHLVAATAGSVAVAATLCEENVRLYTGRTTLVQHITHAWSLDPFHPLMERSRQALAAAGCVVRPGRWQLGRPGLGTAGGVLLNEFKTPVIGYGPGDENLAHAPNESVAVENIVAATYGTAAIVHALIGIPVCGWTSDEI